MLSKIIAFFSFRERSDIPSNICSVFSTCSDFYHTVTQLSFRQEYRQERKSVYDDENIVQNVKLPSPSHEEHLSSENSGRHRISCVVVEHNDSLETFYDFDAIACSLHNEGVSANDVFFDNDSFWSGSITWY